MTDLRARGDDVSVVIAAELGAFRIEGETCATTFDLSASEMASFMVLHQGGARYGWDGEVTYGAIERATPRAKMVVR